MNKMNNAGRLLVLLLAALMALSLAACGAKGAGKMGSEPKSLEEAVAMHKELMAEETAIFSENTALWEKVFMEADKGMAMVEDGKNYGEFLLDTIESAKDQFTASERRLLRGEAKKIRDIESALTMLEEKYPGAQLYMTIGSDMLETFDESVWNAVLENLTVFHDGSLVFLFRDGTEIKV